MTFDLALSPRAERAWQLTQAALGGVDLTRVDDLVRRAAAELGVETAAVSMLADRQITLSACGGRGTVPPRGAATPFEDTICANALRSEEPLAIPDTSRDSRVSSVPAVRSGHVQAYLGAPLRHDGHLVGVLCVVSPVPRQWSAGDLALLQGVAAQVLAALVTT